jgi:hypothetical protein
MKFSKSSNDSQNAGGRLRNFDLSVEEIRTIKAIKDMTQSLDDIKDKNTQPERVEYFRNEITRLEEQLEDIRDNTLIR